VKRWTKKKRFNKASRQITRNFPPKINYFDDHRHQTSVSVGRMRVHYQESGISDSV